jgi:hypothetical protein
MANMWAEFIFLLVGTTQQEESHGNCRFDAFSSGPLS